MASNVDIVALGEPLYEFSEMRAQPGTYRQGLAATP
jgi:hypothetical protein